MKAIVWTKYGAADGLQLREVEKPTPGDHEVLIKIHATTVNAGDVEMRTLKVPLGLGPVIRLYTGLFRPMRITVLGQELAGEIVGAGKEVRRFKVGDQVFARTGFINMGAYAEYKCFPEDPKEMEGVIALKPVNLSYEEAAAVPLGGLEALHFLRKGNIQPGEQVLINGAGGSIGTIGIQLAKHYGAEVTAVDRPGKFEMLGSIGADYLVDCSKEDFTENGKKYDVIFDVVGKSPFSRSIRSLKENGRYLLANPKVIHKLRAHGAARRSGKQIFHDAASPRTADLIALKELIEAGKIKPVIDRTFSLEQVVEAHSYVETGGKKGNVVITVTEGS